MLSNTDQTTTIDILNNDYKKENLKAMLGSTSQARMDKLRELKNKVRTLQLEVITATTLEKG